MYGCVNNIIDSIPYGNGIGNSALLTFHPRLDRKTKQKCEPTILNIVDNRTTIHLLSPCEMAMLSDDEGQYMYAEL